MFTGWFSLFPKDDSYKPRRHRLPEPEPEPKEAWRIPEEEEEEDEEGYSCSDLCSFLRRVFREENIDSNYRWKAPLPIAVHGILLESGLVGLDPATRTQIHQFNLPKAWSYSLIDTFSYMYTLPEILIRNNNQDNCTISDDLAIVVKFVNMPFSLRVSGPWTAPIPDSRKYMYTLDLNYRKFEVIVLYLLGDEKDSFVDNYVNKMRKIVRKQFTSRLIASLRAKAGLSGPPLVDLPRELQIRIFRLLPPKDLVKVGCVCRQLNRLCCDEKLLEQRNN